MPLDATANFVRGETDSSLTNSDTTVSVNDASIFPDPATEGEYNVVIWDVADHPRPDQDPDVEVLRVTAIDTTNDNLTVNRGQETTTGVSHPLGSAVHLAPTAKMFGDIEATFNEFYDDSTQELTADVNTDSVNTEEANIEQALRVGGTYRAKAGEETILEALQRIPAGSNGEFPDTFLGEVKLVPTEGGPTFDAIDYQDINGASDDTPSGVTIKGTGLQSSTAIVGSGAHTVELSTNDAYLANMSVRQEDDSGDYDAVHISEREAKVVDVGIDNAPRYGVNDNASQSHLRGLEIAGGGTYAVRVSGNYQTHIQCDIKAPPADGLLLDNTQGGCFQYIMRDVSLGCYVNGSVTNSTVDITVENPSDAAIRAVGNGGRFGVSCSQGSGDVVDIDGHFGGHWTVNVGANVLLDSNSENNVVVGVCESFTDNGTNNDTSSLLERNP